MMVAESAVLQSSTTLLMAVKSSLSRCTELSRHEALLNLMRFVFRPSFAAFAAILREKLESQPMVQAMAEQRQRLGSNSTVCVELSGPSF